MKKFMSPGQISTRIREQEEHTDVEAFRILFCPGMKMSGTDLHVQNTDERNEYFWMPSGRRLHFEDSTGELQIREV